MWITKKTKRRLCLRINQVLHVSVGTNFVWVWWLIQLILCNCVTFMVQGVYCVSLYCAVCVYVVASQWPCYRHSPVTCCILCMWCKYHVILVLVLTIYSVNYSRFCSVWTNLKKMFCNTTDNNVIVSYRIVSYRIVSYRIVSYRIVSYRIVSYRIVSYRIVFLLQWVCTSEYAEYFPWLYLNTTMDSQVPY